jgi:SAM-dependent methyltransferase
MSNGGPGKQGKTAPGAAQADPWNTNTPNVSRIYDYYLGSKDNYAQDREAARKVLGLAPDVPLAALENREFLRRAIQFLVEEAGIRQFIDIGPGLPTQGNVHEIAWRHDASAHVAYVDNDPVVLAHGRAILQTASGVRIIEGDVRCPEAILASAELRELIDLSRPVALCMSLLLHFVTEDEDPYAAVATLRDALAPGSYLVLTHVTGDDRDVGTVSEITAVYDTATASLVPRTREQVTKLFDGFELVEPDVVFSSQWRPTGEYHARGGTRWAYAGVGRKAEARL